MRGRQWGLRYFWKLIYTAESGLLFPMGLVHWAVLINQMNGLQAGDVLYKYSSYLTYPGPGRH